MKECNSCIFNRLASPFTFSNSNARGRCGGSLQRLFDVAPPAYARPPYVKYGAKSLADTILLRGGIIVDWDDSTQSALYVDEVVCHDHIMLLLHKWDRNSFAHIPYGKGIVCSLPKALHPSGNRVKTKLRLSRDDVIKYMNYSQQLCHIGSPVCSTHKKALETDCLDQIQLKMDNVERDEEGDTGGVPPESDLNQMMSDVDGGGDDYDDGQEEQNTDKNDPPYEPPLGMKDADNESIFTDAEPENNIEKALALQRCGRIFGIDRLTTETSYGELEESVRIKKVLDVLHFQEEVYKVCGGKDWERLRADCIKKLVVPPDCSRFNKIMESIDCRLQEQTDTKSQLPILSLLKNTLTEKEIRGWTGMSRHMIRLSKEWSIDDVNKIVRTRERHSELKLNFCVHYLSTPEVLTSLPTGSRTLHLTSGEKVSVAAVIRISSYRELYRMFLKYAEGIGMEETQSKAGLQEFVQKHCVSYSSFYKILDTLAPVKKERLSCIDQFFSEALTSFDSSLAMISELNGSQLIDSSTASEMIRRVRVLQNFTKGEHRLHLSPTSSCASHCLNYCLSDPSNGAFSSPCDHEHDTVCTQCDEVFEIMAVLTTKVQQILDSLDSSSPERYRIARLLEECQWNEKSIKEYRMHQVRSTAAEIARRTIIDELEEGECLVIWDFAMKLLPAESAEKQSNFYGKKGVSMHVAYALAKLGGKLHCHTFTHFAQDLTQDAIAVVALAYHVLQKLKESGVKGVYLRSDTAGYYRCSNVISTIFILAQKIGIVVTGYVFSEAQAGKSTADQKISHVKGTMGRFVDAGGTAKNSVEMWKAVTSGAIMKGYSMYEVVITGEGEKKLKSAIKPISNYSSFRFEEGGVRCRRFDGIGEGMLVDKSAMSDIKFKIDVRFEGGCIGNNEHFWVKCGEEVIGEPVVPEEIQCDTEPESVEAVEPEVLEEQLHYFPCPEPFCESRFLTYRGLMNHQLIGSHRIPKNAPTMVDRAIQLFSSSFEDNDQAYQAMLNDSMAVIKPSLIPSRMEQGWAIRKRTNTPIDKDARAYAWDYYYAQTTAGKRADARELEEQAQGLISRWLAGGGVEQTGKKNGRGRQKKSVELEEKEEIEEEVILERQGEEDHTEEIADNQEHAVTDEPKRKRRKHSVRKEEIPLRRSSRHAVLSPKITYEEGEDEVEEIIEHSTEAAIHDVLRGELGYIFKTKDTMIR